MEKSTSSRLTFRQTFAENIERHDFYHPSGKISGFYDYGHLGSHIKKNICELWHRHFLDEEEMFLNVCPCITPEEVLKASGHVEKFTDHMVKDTVTGTCHRADHLLKDHGERKLIDKMSSDDEIADLKKTLAILDDLSMEELGDKIKQYKITAPDTNNALSDPYPFNLMFKTSVGPNRGTPSYLRPETAQGLFARFNRLYRTNSSKLPLAVGQIGSAFRNEISPRQSLLRVREFTLAEIEHFFDPLDKSHPKFPEVADLELYMFPREEQISGQVAKKTQLGEAVRKGIVSSETVGYFIGRVYLFLTLLGIDKDRLRFRQHLQNEMAHYAVDCWDAEIECSYGWIECVGIADRSDYDLRAHSKRSGVPLVARETFSKPREVEELVITPDDKELGIAFRGSQRMVSEALKAMDEATSLKMKDDLDSKGEVEFYVCTLAKNVSIKKSMVKISKETKKQFFREFTPHVIEPSFGIGRIIYCLLEHEFYTRLDKHGDKQLNVFRFPPLIAPYKCFVLPLVVKDEYKETARLICKELKKREILYKRDDSGSSIGKRYVKADELGAPFAITVDSASSVTIRERDSRAQARVDVDKVASVVKKLTKGKISWDDVLKAYPCSGPVLTKNEDLGET